MPRCTPDEIATLDGLQLLSDLHDALARADLLDLPMVALRIEQAIAAMSDQPSADKGASPRSDAT